MRSVSFLTASISGLSPQRMAGLSEDLVDLTEFLPRLATALLRIPISLSLSQGFTVKSKAPRFMPSTAREMSAYAVKSTTGMSGQRAFSSPSQ